MVRIYTRGGDDGSTALRVGGRVRKDDDRIELVGSIDEAQAALGLARAEAQTHDQLDELLSSLERDLWILMAEVMIDGPPSARDIASGSVVTAEMVTVLEQRIDGYKANLDLSGHFAVPGENKLSASLDFARTVIRRAERRYVGLAQPDSKVGAYLNRLSDLCWTLARAAEDEHVVNRRPKSGAT